MGHRTLLWSAIFATILSGLGRAQESQSPSSQPHIVVDCVKDPQNSLCPQAEQPAKPESKREASSKGRHGSQTTLFGTTLGQADPELHCGASEPIFNQSQADQHESDACGLGDNADVGPMLDQLDGRVEQITAWWLPAVCPRVVTALRAKFGPPAVSSWRGKNGFGGSISGTVWTWRRKNGDLIQWTSPSPDYLPDCRLNASTVKWREQPKKDEDHL